MKNQISALREQVQRFFTYQKNIREQRKKLLRFPITFWSEKLLRARSSYTSSRVAEHSAVARKGGRVSYPDPFPNLERKILTSVAPSTPDGQRFIYFPFPFLPTPRSEKNWLYPNAKGGGGDLKKKKFNGKGEVEAMAIEMVVSVVSFDLRTGWRCGVPWKRRIIHSASLGCSTQFPREAIYKNFNK